jgi:uncharacterized protein (TIGR00266 family)
MLGTGDLVALLFENVYYPLIFCLVMRYEIFGDNLQMVIIDMDGEKLFGEAGSMVYMSEGIKMEATARGGIMKGLGRKIFLGESFFMTEFSGKGRIAFAGNVPGKVIPIDLAEGRDVMAQKDAFLCAQEGVNLEVAFQKKLGSALFGGEGLIIEKIYGRGHLFLHACGDIKEIELGQGEKVMVDTGSAVAWESGVDYDISTVPGIKTALFGGEGIFLTTLKGPGKVWIQSMTLHNLASALEPFLPKQSSGNQGGVLGGLFR